MSGESSPPCTPEGENQSLDPERGQAERFGPVADIVGEPWQSGRSGEDEPEECHTSGYPRNIHVRRQSVRSKTALATSVMIINTI